MRKVVLYIAMSLDGYIADKKGGVEWLQGDASAPESEGSYPVFYESIDTILIGYKTYQQIVTSLSPGSWVYTGKKTYVCTSRDLESHDGITFTPENIEVIIERLKQELSLDIWICGGASIAQALIKADLIDCYRITIVPCLLGGGISLFADTAKELKLISTTHTNGFVELFYERR